MKKNITINLFGSLYAIDEDACRLLEQYLDNMQSYFGRRDGGDEIADDIEHRVAELFAELRAEGVEAISIEHVQDIIRRIGNPEEMDTESDRPEPASETATDQSAGDSYAHMGGSAAAEKVKSWFSGRRLYRDPEDCLLGGVMSGLCQYCGGTDPLPWRIIMVILTFFSLATMGILYLLLWAFVPAARTAEERLRMRGLPVTPETLNEELMRGAARADSTTRYERSWNTARRSLHSARGCLGTLVSLLVWGFKLVCLFFVGGGLLALLIVGGLFLFGILGGAASLVSTGMWDGEFVEMLHASPALHWSLWGLGASAAVFLGILLYGLVRSLIISPADPPLRPATRGLLVAVAVLSLAGVIVSGCLTAVYFKHAEHLINTQDGIYLDEHDRYVLNEEGWELKKLDNCNSDGDLVAWNYGFDEKQLDPYLRFVRDEGARHWAFDLQRTAQFPAGRYHLEALVRAGGYGAAIYHGTGGDAVRTEVPSAAVTHNGQVSAMDYAAARATAVFPDTISEVWWLTLGRERLGDWTWVRSETFVHPGGPLVYGCAGNMGMDAPRVSLGKLIVVPETGTAAADSTQVVPVVPAQ